MQLRIEADGFSEGGYHVELRCPLFPPVLSWGWGVGEASCERWQTRVHPHKCVLFYDLADVSP